MIPRLKAGMGRKYYARYVYAEQGGVIGEPCRGLTWAVEKGWLRLLVVGWTVPFTG